MGDPVTDHGSSRGRNGNDGAMDPITPEQPSSSFGFVDAPQSSKGSVGVPGLIWHNTSRRQRNSTHLSGSIFRGCWASHQRDPHSHEERHQLGRKLASVQLEIAQGKEWCPG